MYHAIRYGQTIELHHAISNGSSLGLARSPTTLLEDMAIVRPTVLVAVPQLFNRVYDALQTMIAESAPVKKAVLTWALGVAKDRRVCLDTGTTSALVWLQWNVAERLVLRKIKDKFGGRLRYALTGGAALPYRVQEFFDDIGIPLMEGTPFIHLHYHMYT